MVAMRVLLLALLLVGCADATQNAGSDDTADLATGEADLLLPEAPPDLTGILYDIPAGSRKVGEDWHSQSLGFLDLNKNSASQVRAFSVSDGAPLWSGLPATPVNLYGPLSSDGTRTFGIAGCDLVAINAANGSVAWQVSIRQSWV